MLVYAYFQIPLMVLVFLPSLDGLRPQWREAAESLGGTTAGYWRMVAVPMLPRPSSARCCCSSRTPSPPMPPSRRSSTRAAPSLPLQIGNAISSEVGGAPANYAKALALLMIVSSRWS